MQIYHNPRCSKSRQALALLQERGVEPEIIQYLQTPPTEAQLREILQKLDMGPRDLLRRREPEYKALALEDTDLSDSQIIAAVCEHPKLIERPIVVTAQAARIGRPPEKVLELL